MSKSEQDTFHFKTYATKQGKLVAACDADLVGRSFKEGKARLRVNKDFYSGDEGDFAAIKQELEAAQIANLVGERLISQLINEGYLTKDEIKTVEDVPHSQIFVI